MQGNCNSELLTQVNSVWPREADPSSPSAELLRNIQTNVQYAIDPKESVEWVAWTDNDSWFVANNWNKIITYPHAVPQARGISNAVCANPP